MLWIVLEELLRCNYMNISSWAIYRPLHTLVSKLEIYMNCFPIPLLICSQTATFGKFVHSKPPTEFGLVKLEYMNLLTGCPSC